MAIEYEAKEWQNDSVGGTPITADEMNRIDSGVADAVNGVNELNEPGNVTTDDLADGAVTADKLSQEVRDSVSQIAKYVTRQQTVQSVAAGQFVDDVHFDISDLSLANAPIVVPLSTGWITTMAATEITATGFEGHGVNWSSGGHSGNLSYLIIAKG